MSVLMWFQQKKEAMFLISCFQIPISSLNLISYKDPLLYKVFMQIS